MVRSSRCISPTSASLVNGSASCCGLQSCCMLCSRSFSPEHGFNYESQTNQTNRRRTYEIRTNTQQEKPMKINRLILIGGTLAGIIIANPFTTYADSPTPAPNENALITWTAGG